MTEDIYMEEQKESVYIINGVEIKESELPEVFKEGDVFTKEYPVSAAMWCNNSGNHYISEIDKDADGNRQFIVVKVPDPTEEEIAAQTQAHYTALIQKVLDDAAKELGYDNCLSVCSYVDTGVAKFDAEGTAFRAWRSAVWAKGYEILDMVIAGQMEIPTEEELLELLPELVIEYPTAE